MTQLLDDRLDEILGRITTPDFLSSTGIGNEIACYVFEYPADQELKVREHLDWLVGRLASHHASVDVLHLDLLDVLLAYLDKRELRDRILEFEQSKGSEALVKTMKGPVSAEKICRFIDESHAPSERDLLLISGVGSVWPVLRAHSLLNCLHTAVQSTPLVMFYPGTFDGTTLRLFGQPDSSASTAGSSPYYRAFRLVP